MLKYKIFTILIVAVIVCLILACIIIIVKKCIRIWSCRRFIPQCNSQDQVIEFNKELYPSGFAYDPRSDIFYSLRDAWQRNYGYKKAYDELAPYFNMIFDSEPIKFWYRGRYWLIELWKGQYGLSTGAEVGIYVSDDGWNFKCISENEEILMGLTLLKDDTIIAQRYDRHWWLTTFVLGEYSRPEELTMIVELNLYDTEMCLAVVNALRNIGYNGENFIVYKNTIRIKYEKPYCVQSKSRRSLSARINSWKNKRNCRIYRRYTSRYFCTLDRIAYIRIRIPCIYKALLKVLSIWKKIND